ncbi:armadillo repeat-containing protein 7 [Vanessa tameamea]|uniref:Armadillo repeat-containing protein 7 n=1 Tax=Vanessa tameamea TaxID=334116 RepID=A0A8B8HLW9_VANTA
MFSSQAQLRKRTPEDGTDRENYLSLLVDEFINTNSFEAKCQVLANLANFAYDPINYVYIRDVGVLDIFIFVLKNEKNVKLLHFAASGICNLCIDPVNVEYLLNHEALKPIAALLKSNHCETVADAVAICIYLFNSHAKATLNVTGLIQDMELLKNSENIVVANLATVFLDDISKNN